MITTLNRRDALIHLGLGAAGLVWGSRGAAVAGDLELGDLTDLAGRLRAAPRSQVFDVAAAAIRAGAGYRKYAAAIEEESALVHPRWASRILAPAVTYVPTRADPETETYERSRYALEQAGMIL